ncbi:MAG TPA: type II secretion system protein [Patescibacteria group bacterium]|nr:type II secretion system protein [Patescibacteria group bacterium]
MNRLTNVPDLVRLFGYSVFWLFGYSILSFFGSSVLRFFRPLRFMRKGFTLIELLVTMGIITILSSVVLVAVNPAKQLADARDSVRFNDVNSILSALHQCLVDKDGDLAPCGLQTSMPQTQIGWDFAFCHNDGCGAVSQCADLRDELAPYLKSLPFDPLSDDDNETRYSAEVDANNIITITACLAENTTISVSR